MQNTISVSIHIHLYVWSSVGAGLLEFLIFVIFEICHLCLWCLSSLSRELRCIRNVLVMLCMISLEAHVKSIQGVIGTSERWCHEPRSYKACPNEAVTSFLCLHKRSVWNYPCLIWCCLSVIIISIMASKQQQGFRMCVHPCPHYLMGGDTHILCVVCLGEEHCDVLPLRMLRSRLAFFPKDAQARVPQGSGPAAAKAQRRLRSWGSQRDLSAEVETGAAFSLPSPDRFSASSQGWEAHAVVSSALIEAQTLQLSDSEELDVVSANAMYTEDSPPQLHAYEELVEVVTRVVKRLIIDWSSEREDVRSKSRLDEHLPSRAQPQHWGLPFFSTPRLRAISPLNHLHPLDPRYYPLSLWEPH